MFANHTMWLQSQNFLDGICEALFLHVPIAFDCFYSHGSIFDKAVFGAVGEKQGMLVNGCYMYTLKLVSNKARRFLLMGTSLE